MNPKESWVGRWQRIGIYQTFAIYIYKNRIKYYNHMQINLQEDYMQFVYMEEYQRM